MSELISCCMILVEIIAGLLFCGGMLPQRKKTWVTVVSILATGFVIFAYTNFSSVPIPAVYITTLAYFVLSFICYRGSWVRHLIVVIMCILLLAIMDTFVVYLASSLLRFDINEIYTKKYLYLTVVTVSKGLSVLAAWIFWRIQQEKNHLQLSIRWLFLTLLFPIISLIMLVVLFESFQQGNDVSIHGLIFTVAISLGNVAIMYIIHLLEKAERKLLHSTLLSQQMEVQTKSIVALEKSYRAQRKAAHEFNHHLSTINSLLSKGQYNTATQYIGRLCSQQSSRVFSVNTHNPIIDAILNQKYQLAAEMGIEMQFKVNDLSNVPIPTDAIVVVLSNLLDNAIEACSKCPVSKIIRFSMISNSTVFLTIGNTSLPVSIVNGEIATTKGNKGDHGYGLINVKCILQDLGAEFALRYNDGWFTFVAEIPCK